MSSYFLRSVLAGLTTCMLLVLFSGCGTEKGSQRNSPDVWPASTWKFDSAEGGDLSILIDDQFTFSGGNAGRFGRTVSLGQAGNYTYTKTGDNTGTLLIIFDGNPVGFSLNLRFETTTGGTGTLVAPGDPNFGDRVYQIRFRRL